MKILIDMNLSPLWVPTFSASEIDSIHWSSVGDPKAEDAEIFDWARRNGYIVFTHDLDFGTILALTRAAGPSVIQMRTQNVLPESGSKILVSVIQANLEFLEKGALITIDDSRARVRILPL